METNGRSLSAAEYFDTIQREYLIADFRRKIYYNPKDRAYYKRLMEHKAEKIRQISERNGLLSILNKEQKRKEVWDELFDKGWKPKFEMTDVDRKNYYLVGNEFSYDGEIYVLGKVDLENGIAILSQKHNKKFLSVGLNDVCRIL